MLFKYISLAGYQPPTGQFGFGLVKSSETQLVECPVEGVPGPSRFYWQRGQRINALRYRGYRMCAQKQILHAFVQLSFRLRNVPIIVALHITQATQPPSSHTHRVTTQTDLLSGPFVDSMGCLNLSKAQNSGIYRSIDVPEWTWQVAVDLYQLFNIEINNVDGKL